MSNKIKRGLDNYRIWKMVFLIQIFTFSNISSQHISAFNFDHLTIEEGLSHNTILSLEQDRNGYIWIGTQNGLNKYDGYTFDLLLSLNNDEDIDGFIGKNISALFEDSNGNLWVGTKRWGINFKPRESNRFVNLSKSEAFFAIWDTEISSFYEDKEGNIWIATIGKGLLKYDPKTKLSASYTSSNSDLKSNTIFEVLEDNDGLIWIASEGPGILSLSPFNGGITQYYGADSENPAIDGYRKSLFLDGDELWIGTEGTGVYRMNIYTKIYKHYKEGIDDVNLNSSIIRDILVLDSSSVYIATDGGGLNILNLDTDKIIKSTNESNNPYSINSNALYCFLKDESDNIWIGTYNGGINILKKDKTWFELYSPQTVAKKILDQRSVLCITEDKQKNIWIGTDGGGINKLEPINDGYNYSSYKVDPQNNNSISGNVVKSIFEDSRGDLWFGTFAKGLNKFDSKTQKIDRIVSGVEGIENFNIWTIDESNNGDLWFGTIGNGLFSLDRNNNFKSYTHNEGLGSIASNNISIIKFDNKNRLWVGTSEDGLSLMESGQEEFVSYSYNRKISNAISNDEIRSIYQDSKDRIWVGTEGGGLNLYNEEKKSFSVITKEDGLIANSIMGIEEDEFGRLWISTFEGISIYDVENKKFRNFDFHTVNNSNQFNQMAICKNANGKMFFGGINGMNAIYPKDVKINTKKKAFKFTKLEILNELIEVDKKYNYRVILKKPIEDADEIHLGYQDKTFTIYFSSFNYTDSQDEKFEYKMEGFDVDWIKSIKGQHSVTYTNLDPGNYIFKIRNENNLSQIAIKIRPPFWESIWFKLVSLISIIIAVLTTVWFIMKRKEEEHKKEMLVAEKEILELQNINLEHDVKVSNSKLLSSTVLMAHKNEILNDVKSSLENVAIESRAEMRPIIRKLNWELKNEDYWDEFNFYINKVDKNFVDRIFMDYPELTQNDVRICSLLRLKLSTKEIASLLNVSVRGVEKGKYRLKKRLELTPEDDLIRFIREF
jgi:streptogramin lyase/DNA-binding CsgD family transcriptional regulator